MKQKVFICAFLALCLIPLVGMFFLPGTDTLANEKLAAKPEFITASGTVDTAALDETTDYIADHFGFRPQLITVNAALQTKLLHTAPAEDVIYGADGWLYYEETLHDYQNIATITDAEAEQIAQRVLELQEYCTARGADFLFTIAPNKNSLYPQYMPTRYLQAESAGNYEMILPYLTEKQVQYVDLFAFFGEQDDIYYYQTDSHWTSEGAALVHQELMETLGIPYTGFTAVTTQTQLPHRGDLYQMLYPTGTMTEPQSAYDFSFTYVSTPRTEEDIIIETRSETGGGRLIFCRDSFGNALYPFLAEDFSEAVITRQTPYPLEAVQAGDTVIIEIVERNLPSLLQS
ncbi:MAG: hypothetical protein LUG13_01165 [Oscillospiraceae bacterium]|nr:hypothetical protein [Oscillospiraceae bacterium]